MTSFTKLSLALASYLAVITLAVLPLPAQDKPAETGGRAAGGERARGILDGLSEEDRQRFRAAVNEVWHAEKVERRRKAMLEANLAYREALQEEIRQLDVPSDVRANLLKIMKLRFVDETAGGDLGHGGANDHGGAGGSGAAKLSEQERAILKAARVQAEATAEVIVAKEEVAAAVTARDRLAASANFRRAMRHAMEQADPRVRPILARRDQHPKPRPSERQEAGKPRKAPKNPG